MFVGPISSSLTARLLTLLTGWLLVSQTPCRAQATPVILPPGAEAAAKKIQRILWVRAEFPDTAMGLTEAVWRARLDILSSRMAGYWNLHSYRTQAFTIAYTPILQMPQPALTPDSPYLDVGVLRAQMRQKATDAGLVLSDFDHLILSYPSIPSNSSFGALGTPGTIWLPGTAPFDGGLIHEFGHALGVGHAHSIEALGVPFPGQRREGRDGLVMMGSDNEALGLDRVGDYSTINLPMRWRMGFFPNTYLASPTTSGTYRIYEHELPTLPSNSTLPLGLRIRVGSDDFWLTYNPQMAVRWGNYNGAGWAQGLIVHRLIGDITDLLDFTPGSQGGTGDEADYVDTRDGALTVGRSYTFPSTSPAGGVILRPTATGTAEGLRYIELALTIPPSFLGVFTDARDLGTPVTPGSTTAASNTVYTTTAGGTGIRGQADQFHFISKPLLNGGSQLSARIDSLINSNVETKAGVMIRDALTPTAAHVSVTVLPDGRVSMLWRSTDNAPTTQHPTVVGAPTFPKWVRLVRTAGTVSGYHSADGQRWQLIATTPLSLLGENHYGLATVANRTSVTTTAAFSQVSATELSTETITYDQWAATAFPSTAPSAQTSSTADPDGDSIPNSLEFLVGSSPLLASAPPLEIIPPQRTLRYPLRSDAFTSPILEFSTTLDKWENAQRYETSREPSGTGLWIVTLDPSPVFIGNTRVFFRLRSSLN